jgi:hypothetical protein
LGQQSGRVSSSPVNYCDKCIVRYYAKQTTWK